MKVNKRKYPILKVLSPQGTEAYTGSMKSKALAAFAVSRVAGDTVATLADADAARAFMRAHGCATAYGADGSAACVVLLTDKASTPVLFRSLSADTEAWLAKKQYPAVAFAVIRKDPNAPDDGDGWATCAGEGGTCACTGRVRYGAAGKWGAKIVEPAADGASSATRWATPCTNNVFGDPVPGTSKECQCHPLTAAAAAAAKIKDGTLKAAHEKVADVLRIDIEKLNKSVEGSGFPMVVTVSGDADAGADVDEAWTRVERYHGKLTHSGLFSWVKQHVNDERRRVARREREKKEREAADEVMKEANEKKAREMKEKARQYGERVKRAQSGYTEGGVPRSAPCPAACRTCKQGGDAEGRPLHHGVCLHWCSSYGYCGTEDTYARNGGIDCRGCTSHDEL